MNKVKENSLITLLDWSTERIQKVLKIARDEKASYKSGSGSRSLTGKTVALFFEKPSLRTYTTFQVGVSQLGGACTDLDPNIIQIGKRESIEDVGRCVGRWVDAIVIRCFEQKLIEDFAIHSKVPVINALSDDFHPCQALALVQSLEEHWNGAIDGKKLVFVGDGNNVANSFAIIAAKLGMSFTLACPKGYEQDEKILDLIKEEFSKSSGEFAVDYNPETAVNGADLIYTDVWASMGQESEQEERKKIFMPYQVNSELVAKASKDVLISHCLPAHRGEEITHEVLESAACICFDEAENRLHAQKAVLLDLIG